MILGLLTEPNDYIKSIAGKQAVTKSNLLFEIIKTQKNGDFISRREVQLAAGTPVTIDVSNQSPKVATDDLYTFVVSFRCNAIAMEENETLQLRIHRTNVKSVFEGQCILSH